MQNISWLMKTSNCNEKQMLKERVASPPPRSLQFLSEKSIVMGELERKKERMRERET